MRRIVSCLAVLVTSVAAAASLDRITHAEAVRGLRQALDGLYFMIGEQEKVFRKDPVRASSDIVKKVFGALR